MICAMGLLCKILRRRTLLVDMLAKLKYVENHTEELTLSCQTAVLDRVSGDGAIRETDLSMTHSSR